MFDGAKPRDLRFSSPATNLSWKQPLSPLSSRAKPRDLRFSSPATNSQLETPLSPLSSRVLDGPGGPPKKMNMRPGPHVRRSEAEGPAVLFTSNQSQLETTTLPFVIPSEAEGPAVLFTSNQLSAGNTTLPFVIPSVGWAWGPT